MEQSQSIMELVKALVLAQKEFEPIKKQVLNEFYGVKYAPLNEVIRATREALTKHGLAFTQDITLQEQSVSVTTTLMHNSGEWMRSSPLTLPGIQVTEKATRFNAQSVGSAITYARRYSLQTLLGVAAEEDDDSELATHQDRKQQLKEAVESFKLKSVTGTVTTRPELAEEAKVSVVETPPEPAHHAVIVSSSPETGQTIKEQVAELREHLLKSGMSDASNRLKAYALKVTGKTDVRTIEKTEWLKIIGEVRTAIEGKMINELLV